MTYSKKGLNEQLVSNNITTVPMGRPPLQLPHGKQKAYQDSLQEGQHQDLGCSATWTRRHPDSRQPTFLLFFLVHAPWSAFGGPSGFDEGGSTVQLGSQEEPEEAMLSLATLRVTDSEAELSESSGQDPDDGAGWPAGGCLKR